MKNKHHNIIIWSLIIFQLFSGCKTIDQFTQFEMDYEEAFIIPSTIGINLPFNLITPEIETNAEETFAINDTRKDLIEKVYLQTIALSITQPENADFSFLNSIEIYLQAEGLSDVKVAWDNDIEGNGMNSIQLNTSDENIDAFIKRDSFQLKVTSVTDELILSDHEINVLMTFFVDAKIIGI